MQWSLKLKVIIQYTFQFFQFIFNIDDDLIIACCRFDFFLRHCNNLGLYKHSMWSQFGINDGWLLVKINEHIWLRFMYLTNDI